MSTVLQRIGSYPVERELGRGGMGVVYLGRDLRLDRPVAIKVLPEGFAHDPERLARFEREARILASLSHPNMARSTAWKKTTSVASWPSNTSKVRRSRTESRGRRCRWMRRSRFAARSRPGWKRRMRAAWCRT